MDKATLSVKEFAAYLGIGQNKAYELVAIADQIGLPVLKFGERTNRIPIKALDEWLNSKEGQCAINNLRKL